MLFKFCIFLILLSGVVLGHILPKKAALNLLNFAVSKEENVGLSSNMEMITFIRAGEEDRVQHPITLNSFEKILKNSGSQLVVVDFTATWCRPCQMIAPIFKQMAQKFTRAVFVKVDVDEAAEIAGKFDVKSMPTFMFFKRGKVVDRFSGASVEKLTQFVNKYI